MRKVFLTIIFCLIASVAFATDYCVSQNGSTDCGTLTTNKISVSTFNDGYTGTDYAGDTFYFVGSFTSQIYPKVSGTSGGGYVTFDGWYDGTYNAVDGNHTNLASLAKPLYKAESGGIKLSSNDYTIVQDFNFDGEGTGEAKLV